MSYEEKHKALRHNADRMLAKGLEDLYENEETVGVDLLLGLIDLMRLMENEIVELHEKIDMIDK